MGVITPSYSSTGWLSGLSTQSGSTVTTIASLLAYTGLAGASGQITSMTLGSGDTYAASYDTGMRLTSASLTQASNNAVLYQTQPTYDAVNNVVGVSTSISGQTDTQQFCYDNLDRLTWSGTSGIPPCSGVSFSAGTLTGAQYQQSESYNVYGGLTSGPDGSDTYGDSSHPHAITSTSNGYSAAYDAAGDETCRATSNATTCSGTQTGQQLSYDAEGRLSSWQNQPSNPGSTVNYLYDGSGNRVAMLSTSGSTTTLTAYIGSIEEVQTTGSSTQTTTYYAVGGHRIAANVNGSFYYFGYDALGSQVMVLNASGTVVGSQLYGPYGSSRYSTGTLPTSIGFTGQHTDNVTGLDYYNARYYDPVVGIFLSPDDVEGNFQGTDPYSYVANNPETDTDPTGHFLTGGGEGTTVAAPTEYDIQTEADAIAQSYEEWLLAGSVTVSIALVAIALVSALALIIFSVWLLTQKYTPSDNKGFYHPAKGPGLQQGPTPSPQTAEEKAKVKIASQCPQCGDPTLDLEQSEGPLKGHTLAKHVNTSEATIIQKLQSSKGMTSNGNEPWSRFFTQSVAQNAVYSAISGTVGREEGYYLVFSDVKANFSTGFVYKYANGQVWREQTSYVTLVYSLLKCLVFTEYPVADPKGVWKPVA